MIHGIGIDIIEVNRIRDLAEKNPKFLSRIFTQTEIDYCTRMKNRYQHFAARFAVKEAFFKALGRKINWTDVGIKNLPSGKPFLELPPALGFSFKNAEVSISHIKDVAVAVVILSSPSIEEKD